MSETEKPRVEVDWVKVVAGALAAVSSAVLLSTLGAAGTLVGAALGSVIVSLATSVYGTGLARGTEKVAEAQTVALRKVTSATQQIAQVREEVARDDASEPATGSSAGRHPDESGLDTEATEVLEEAEQQLEEARVELEQAADPDAADATQDGLSLKERLAILPWKRVLLASAGLFVVAMVLLTSFEVIGGRTISSYTGGSSDRDGGTSFGRTFDRRDRDDEPQQPAPSPTRQPSGTATQEPTEQPSDEPTTEPTDEPTREEETPTEEPSEDPTDEPTTDAPTSPTRTPTTRLPSPSTTSPTR